MYGTEIATRDNVTMSDLKTKKTW